MVEKVWCYKCDRMVDMNDAESVGGKKFGSGLVMCSECYKKSKRQIHERNRHTLYDLLSRLSKGLTKERIAVLTAWNRICEVCIDLYELKDSELIARREGLRKHLEAIVVGLNQAFKIKEDEVDVYPDFKPTEITELLKLFI